MADIFSIGITGLNTSKKSLETTSHNLANANTDGYSRQKVNQTTNTPITKSGLIHGTGSRIVSVTRVHDPFIEKRMNSSISDNNYFQERFHQLTQVENIFNEINGDGLNKILNNFFNSFRELANQPENETIRSVVRDNAQLVVKDFKRIRETLDQLAKNIDRKLEGSVADINQTLNGLAKLNRKIAELEAVHDETGDLRDQRDQAVRTLSEFFDVTSYVDDKGHFVVAAKGVGTLIAGTEKQLLKTGPRAKEDSGNNMPGSVDLYFAGKTDSPITNKFSGGRLTSLVNARNGDIRDTQEKIDSIAYDFSKSVNSIHQKGFVNRSIEESINNDGSRSLASKDGSPITGISFFKDLESRENAAAYIDLDDMIKEDLSNICSALEPNAPGDNRVSLAISKLQHEKILNDGTTTLEEQYLQTIGNIGIETGKANLDSEQSEGLLAQTKSLKERLSGVSIDEETANMIKFQHAYEASARVLKTANETFKTVLDIV